MTIRVLVNGAAGRMGSIATQAIAAEPTLSLVATLGREQDLATSIKETEAQVVVDLTNASVVYENTKTIIAAGAYPVIGTTGLTPEQVRALQDLAHQRSLGGIIAPNFSIGAMLLVHLAGIAAKYFPNVEIIETHHTRKLDAPSGTAMKTAEVLAKNRTQIPALKSCHETVANARGGISAGIPIHAVRLPGFVAKEEVIFGGEGEQLHLTHQSIDRQCFMPGLILCCQKAPELTELLYGLEQLLIGKPV